MGQSAHPRYSTVLLGEVKAVLDLRGGRCGTKLREDETQVKDLNPSLSQKADPYYKYVPSVSP